MPQKKHWNRRLIMIAQDYNIDKGGGRMGRWLFAEALKKFQPGMWSQIGTTYESMLYHNPIMWGTQLLVGAFDETTEIKKEEWNIDHPEYRDGITWHEGKTQLQARIESERYDREAIYSGYMKNTDPWALHNVGAMFTSALSDPLTFMPFVGGFSKLGSVGANLSRRLGVVKKLNDTISPTKTSLLGLIARPFKPVGYWATEAGLAETTYQIIKGVARETNGEDVDYMGALTDIGIVTLAGGVLGTFPMAKNFRKNFSKEELYDAMGVAINSMKQKGRVILDGDASGVETIKTADELKADYKSKTEEYHKTEAYETDADLHPLMTYLGGLAEDVNKGFDNIIDKFRRCIK